MIQFLRGEFEMPHNGIDLLMKRFQKAALNSNNQSKLTLAEKTGLLNSLNSSQYVCKKLKLVNSLEVIRQIKQDLWSPNSFPFHHDVSTQLRMLWNTMEKDMAERQFAFIPPEKVEYFGSVGNGALFGISVHNNFLSASADIENSGNCLAADLNDAAAFHLLRVVEIGLRELARNLGIKKIAKAPLDYTGWESLVREINGKLEFKIPKVRGHKKSSALKFKQDLLADFSAFGVLRTEVMHGRSHHNEKQAIGLFERVREFMQRLDAQIFPVRKTSGVRSSKNLKKADSITKEAAERYADNLMRELAGKKFT